MGLIRINATVRNPAEPDRAWEGLFLVDSGAFNSVVPRRHLDAIGLTPEGQRTYRTADGRQVRMDITVAQIEFMGELTAGTIVFGDDNAEPLLGVTTLEDAGLAIDPQNQTLTTLSVLPLPTLLPVDQGEMQNPPNMGVGRQPS